MAFKLGAACGSVEVFLDGFRVTGASPPDLGLATAFPLGSFFPFTESCPAAGVNPLLKPSLPRFIMLAGVTGVICRSGLGDICIAPFIDDDATWLEGGAGGGIDRSTGDGESPSTTVLFLLDLEDRINGVEFVDLEPRVGFLMLCDGFDGRIAGDCRLRLGFEEPSSPLGEAVLLLPTRG